MIAIKDMEMPKSCSKCPFKATFPNTGLKNGVCNDLHIPFKRHPYCPLVEIITCNGCKYWNKDSSPRVPDNKEYHFCPIMDCNTAEDFYCADGERRE